MHQGDQGRVGAHRKPLPGAVPGQSHHPRTPSLELPRHSRAPCAGAVAQASGFYCPGYDDDAVNEPPGCKPIPIGSGGFRTTEEKTVITQTIELDMSVDEFDEVARANTVERLAKLYNVSADSISLSVEAGSLVLSFTITPLDDSSVEVLQVTVLTANSSVLSRALGTNVTITQPAAKKKIEVEAKGACPVGHWCSAALSIPCTPNTYHNASAPAISAAACVACPKNAESPEASPSIRDCVCKEEYFDRAPAADEVECVLCMVGSVCDSIGVTLAALPLKRGYYRTSNASEDLRRCPDYGNASGCVGGQNSDGRDGPCAAWLAGPYCQLCNISDTSRYYNAEESACLPCEGDSAAPILIGAGVTVVVVVAALLWAHFKLHQRVPSLKRLGGRLWRLYAQLSLRAKLKQAAKLRHHVVHTHPMPSCSVRALGARRCLGFIKLFHAWRASTTCRCPTRCATCSPCSRS